MTWVAEGCRHTGLYMTIKGQTRELCEAVGGFGYVVQHTGDAPVTDWNETLQGSGVTRVSDAIYRVQVPQGGIATVTTRANPQDSGQSNGGSFAALLTGGVAIPHGSFANTHDPGFTIRGGVEYIATTNLSLEGIARYQRFPAQVGPGMNSYQLSANAKAYVSSGSIRPFVNGGIGSYKLSGAWEFGGNLGGGLLMRANSQVSVLGAYNLHLVNTAATTTKFSTIEGGIRYRF
jgi:opacity protein-like surface antigen